MGEAPKKKRGLLRRSVGAVGRGSAKVIGTTAKVTAKGTGKVAKVTVKGAKGAGRTAVHGARKAFPREEGESVKEYRIRMAKLGFKVSLWTGTIVPRVWKLGFVLLVVLAIGIVITFVGILNF
jgi:hypothetical protein